MENSFGDSYTIFDRIKEYEENFERPVCNSQKHMEAGITALWACATVGLIFYAYQQWAAGELPLNFAALQERQWTVFEQRLGVAYGLASAATLYRDTFSKWHAEQRALEIGLLKEYGKLLVELADYLDNTDFQYDKKSVSKYLKLPLLDEANEYRSERKEKPFHHLTLNDTQEEFDSLNIL